MGLILFIVFGVVAGLVARATMPGTKIVGTAVTVGLSIAASFIGAFFAGVLTSQQFGDLHIPGVIGGACGALAILYLLSAVVGGRGETM